MKIHELLEKYAGQPVDVLSHGGVVPTQVECKIAGYHLYYRARHGEFTVCVADTRDHAIQADVATAEGVIYFIEGDDPTDGYVPEDVYTDTVDKAIDFTLIHDTMNTMSTDDFMKALGVVTDHILKVMMKARVRYGI